MLGNVLKYVVLVAAVVAYLVYVLFHPKYYGDAQGRLRTRFFYAGTILWGFLVAAGLVLTLVLRAKGLIPAGILAILLGYTNFRSGANSMTASVLDRPMFFSSGRNTAIWILSCIAVVLLGLTALLVHRLVLAPVAVGGLVLLHFAANTVSGTRAGYQEMLLVQTIVQSYVAARDQAGSAPEGTVLTLTLDLAAARLAKRIQGDSWDGIGSHLDYHLDYLRREVATGEVGDIAELAELALAIIYPLREWNDGGLNGLYRRMAEYERREKLVASCLDAAAIPARLRGKKGQPRSTEHEPC